jgi:Protein of unknown function (DUF1161)
MLKFLLPAVVLACLSAPSYADNCDDLRAQIDAKIKAAGVASYSVTVVDIAASAPGKVVGSCARGQKKIMYAVNATSASMQTKPPAATASAPASATSAAAVKKPTVAVGKSGEAILTECKDGTVSKGGSCKK